MQNNLGVAPDDYVWFGLDNKSNINQFSITILVDSNLHDNKTYLLCNKKFAIQFRMLIKESYRVEPGFENFKVYGNKPRAIFNDCKTNLQSVSKAVLKGRSITQKID